MDRGGSLLFAPASSCLLTQVGMTMLVLTRRIGEEIVIEGNMRVRVLGVNNGKVQLGFIAPATIAVHREEIVQRLERAEKVALQPAPVA